MAAGGLGPPLGAKCWHHECLRVDVGLTSCSYAELRSEQQRRLTESASFII